MQREVLTDAEFALIDNTPTWYAVVFGIAVVTGVLGSLFLLLRKKLAILLFTISAVAVIIQMGYWILGTNVIEVYGTLDAITMPLIVVITAIVLLFYSKTVARKGWLS